VSCTGPKPCIPPMSAMVSTGHLQGVKGLLPAADREEPTVWDGLAQTVQVLIWKAPARHAVSAESSTSRGWKGLTPSMRSSSRKP
jgi:hypothetical protein